MLNFGHSKEGKKHTNKTKLLIVKGFYISIQSSVKHLGVFLSFFFFFLHCIEQ